MVSKSGNQAFRVKASQSNIKQRQEMTTRARMRFDSCFEVSYSINQKSQILKLKFSLAGTFIRRTAVAADTFSDCAVLFMGMET